MKLIVDMNLSPGWVSVLKAEGWEAWHWSEIGDPRDPDESIVQWCRANGAAVITQDLGFGTTIALTRAESPSIVLLRMTGSTLPEVAHRTVVAAIRAALESLTQGAILVVGDAGHRVRVLPLGEPD